MEENAACFHFLLSRDAPKEALQAASELARPQS